VTERALLNPLCIIEQPGKFESYRQDHAFASLEHYAQWNPESPEILGNRKLCVPCDTGAVRHPQSALLLQSCVAGSIQYGEHSGRYSGCFVPRDEVPRLASLDRFGGLDWKAPLFRKHAPS
jgi:hypothetical protein